MIEVQASALFMIGQSIQSIRGVINQAPLHHSIASAVEQQAEEISAKGLLGRIIKIPNNIQEKLHVAQKRPTYTFRQTGR